jgi:hypothetical protein
MNKKLIFYTVALTAGLLTACSSDDEQKQEPPVRHISVEVSERPMAEEGTAEGRSLTTRAAITTTETLGDFTMKGVYDGSESPMNYSVEKSAGKWTVKPDSWPSELDNNTKVQFYAYTNGAFGSSNGTPFIDFTVAENASTQHDLLVAKTSVAYSDHDGKAPLTFDHACAALAFNIFMSNTLSDKLKLGGKTLTVNSIVLKNVCNKGKYNFGTTFNESTWRDVEGSANYTLDNSLSMVITTTPEALSSNHLFMIPQKRAANGTDGTYLEISYTFSGQEGSTAIIPLTVNWEKSTQYTINIKLGTTLIK